MAHEGKKFSTIITVKPQHLDDVNHVNIVVYVQWMQDIAAMHWQAYAPGTLQEEVVWMIKRHEIDYHHQAFLNDELQISTWTGGYTNITWKRHYEITRLVDDKKIISAMSVWIPLNRTTQKPKRIDDIMILPFIGD